MLFTHDTEVSLMGAAALVNTMEGSVPGDDDVDRLTTPDELDAFYGLVAVDRQPRRGGRRLGRRSCATSAHCDRGCASSGSSTRTAPSTRSTPCCATASALPQLVQHDAWEYHLHATSRRGAARHADGRRGARWPWSTSSAPASWTGSSSATRDDCDDVLVDLSKNRSRRFCDGGCGNRANVAAYRARKAGPASQAGSPRRYRRRRRAEPRGVTFRRVRRRGSSPSRPRRPPGSPC